MQDTVSIYNHPLPLRHGMTYGELAKMWNETEGYGVDLTVIKMKGWRRNMMWNETGLQWVMPSPNIDNWERQWCTRVSASSRGPTCRREGV
jgi:uncharacterized protein YbbC (DUF1343 family)